MRGATTAAEGITAKRTASVRNKSARNRTRLRLSVGACIGLIVAALIAATIVSAAGQSGQTELVSVASGAELPGSDFGTGSLSIATAEPETPLFVHVLGAVRSPGLFQLREGDRVIDVIAAAGGFTDTAEPGGVNLARQLSDGEQLYVPEVGEEPLIPAGALGNAGVGGSQVGGKVNLNTAGLAELETLPRIGPMMAQHILDWREANGRFSSVEDLMSVPGIGDKTLDGLRELVTI